MGSGYQVQSWADQSATAKVDKKQEYQDNTDRIEVERTFSLSKRCYGMSCITTKLGRNAVDIYRIICIRDESVQDSEANTLCSFASVPILA